MSLYKQFATDKNVERDGVVLSYGKNSKNKDINIRIARAGGANIRYTKLLEAAIKPYRRQLQNETMDNGVAEDITMRVYAQSVVLGWEGVENENGNDMEFTVENCMKLFKDLPDLWADILEADAKN